MSWHKSFTAALVEEDERALLLLLDEMPAFETVEEAEGALELVAEALRRFESKKSALQTQMQKVKTEKKFVDSEQIPLQTVRLDLHS
ncbi:hypothetical protein [Hydrogenimonas sp.]